MSLLLHKQECIQHSHTRMDKHWLPQAISPKYDMGNFSIFQEYPKLKSSNLHFNHRLNKVCSHHTFQKEQRSLLQKVCDFFISRTLIVQENKTQDPNKNVHDWFSTFNRHQLTKWQVDESSHKLPESNMIWSGGYAAGKLLIWVNGIFKRDSQSREMHK